MKTLLTLSLAAGLVIWIHRRRHSLRYDSLARAVGAHFAEELHA